MQQPDTSIWMVEDDDDIAFLVQFLLERHGYTVIRARDGREALAQLETLPPPALTLLDNMLPYHDGLTVLETLRDTPGWATVPVLMLTAKSLESDVVRALESGADDYVIKPFQPDELLARIRRLVRRR